MSVLRRRRAGESVFGVLLLLFSVLAFVQAYRISGFSSISSAGVFPMAAAGAMILSAAVVVAGNRRMRPPTDTGGAEASSRRFFTDVAPPVVLAFIALVVLYMLTLDWLGFVVGSGLFLFGGITLLHRRGLVGGLLISAASLAAIYVVFRLVFSVVLPAGRLFQ